MEEGHRWIHGVKRGDAMDPLAAVEGEEAPIGSAFGLRSQRRRRRHLKVREDADAGATFDGVED